ncbi:hypothetical protein [Bradyrhizobium sp. USDA 4486]
MQNIVASMARNTRSSVGVSLNSLRMRSGATIVSIAALLMADREQWRAAAMKRVVVPRGARGQPRSISIQPAGNDAAGNAKGPIDRIGRFNLGRA